MPDKTQKVISIITSVIMIFIITRIVKFIESMPQCSCSVPTKTLDHIAFLEKVVIVFYIVGIMLQLYLWNGPKNAEMKIVDSPVFTASFVFTILVYAFLIHNVNDFRNSIGKNCECADKWEKTVMYIQAILWIISISLFVISALFLLNVGALKQMPSLERTAMIGGFSIIAIVAFSLFGGDMDIFVDYVMKYFDKEGFGGSCNKEKFEGSCDCNSNTPMKI